MKTPLASICLFSFCACVPFLAAQTAPALQTSGTTATSATSDDDEIVHLDTYQVVSGEGTGYSAPDTITGTRQATLLRDLPFSVNVVMSDLMEDFALFDLGDQFGYTSGFSPQDSSGEGYYSLRGFGQSSYLMNGFRRGGMVDQIMISRIEIIKGPAAAMYGQTAPGGILNYITWQPKPKPEYYLQLLAGTYNTQRASLRATGPLYSGKLGKTEYLVGLATQQREYEQNYRTYDQKAGMLMLSHQFPNGTKITLEYDQVKQIRVGESSLDYLVMDATTLGRSRYVGYAWNLFNFSDQGPNRVTVRQVKSSSATLEHRFNQVWSLRAAASYADRDFTRLEATGGRFEPGARTIIFRDPRWQNLTQFQSSAQVDLTGLWRVNDVEHRLLFTFDYSSLKSINYIYDMPTDAAHLDPTIRNLSVDNPNYTLPPFDPSTYALTIGSSYGYKTAVYGSFLRYQLVALQRRLTAVAGVRFDYIDFNNIMKRQSKPYPRAFSPQIGINYKLTPEHTLFANFSQSFTPYTPTTSDVSLDENQPIASYDNQRGTGYEAGIRSLFFDDNLSTTVSAYSIEMSGMPTDNATQTGVDLTTGQPVYTTARFTNGIVRSEGIELDFTYKLGKNIDMMGGWGYANPRYIAAGNDVDLLGRMPANVARVNAGAAGKYTFSEGPLKGLSVNIGLRYMGYSYASITNSTTNATLPNPDGTTRTIYMANPNAPGTILIVGNDGRRDIRTPAYTTVDVGLSYMWHMGKIRHRVQLNIRNLFNEKYLNTSAYAADRLAAYVSYILRY